MIKQLALASLVSGLLATAAIAQASPPAAPAPPAAAADKTPQSADECMQTATDLAQIAEDRKLSEAKLDKIEDLLTKMETHCDAKQFVEAMAVAKDIKAVIETQ